MGIIITYAVQRLFYPEYAKNLVLNPFIDLVSKAKTLLKSAMNGEEDPVSQLREKMEINVILNINKATRLIDEANGELPNVQVYGVICHGLIIHLRRTFKYIAVFTHQVEDQVIILTDELRVIVEKLIDVLDALEFHFK